MVWLVVLALSVLGGALALRTVTVRSPATGVLAHGDKTATVVLPTDDPFAWEISHMATAEALLADPSLSADARRVYERELRTLREETTSIALARTNVAATRTSNPRATRTIRATPRPVPTMEALPRGILDDFGSPFPGREGVVTSAWQDDVDGVWTSVYSGYLPDDSQQGFVYVLRWQSVANGILSEPLTGGRFMTPTQAGGLEIVAYDDGILTLVGKAGHTFSFDVRNLRFGEK